MALSSISPKLQLELFRSRACSMAEYHTHIENFQHVKSGRDRALG